MTQASALTHRHKASPQRESVDLRLHQAKARSPGVPRFLQRRAMDSSQIHGGSYAVQRQKIDEEELLPGKFEPIQRQDEEEDEGEEALQGKFAWASPKPAPAEPELALNRTGMPDQLKAGIEALSGVDLSGVRVHSNSFLSGAGNMAIQRLAADRKKPLQRKLTIGSVDDPLEHEADRVAEQVMRMPAPLEPIDSSAAQIQRKCVCGGTCDSCKADQTDEEHGTVQRKSAARPAIAAAGRSAVTTGMNAPPVVHEVLRSPGQHLDAATRAFFEPRFGSDFGDIRVHTDSTASKSATAVNARAYTAGKNIVFSAGQYAPHSHAGQHLLAHELVHVGQQRNGVVSPSSIQCFPDEPAGGCGLCYGEGIGKVGPRDAGNAAHKAIQNELAPQGVEAELAWGEGRVDLAVVRPISKQVAIAEIKPANDQGMDDGIKQIEERLRVLPKLKAYAGYEWVELYHPVDKRIRFETEAPVCTPPYLVQHGFCFSQDLSVAGPVRGLLYLYFCEPSYSELLTAGCTCECKEPKDQEPKDKEPGPSAPLPEQLLTLGAKLAALLAADGLLSAALSFVGRLALMLTPLLALAALALGIVFLWDKIKWFAQTIAGVAKWVWDKVSFVVDTILDTIKELGIKIGELAVWVGGLVKQLAEKIAQGLLWVGRRVLAGAKWFGGKIASAAEAVWDWLFGSDPEPMIPNIELPITEEPTMRCGTVAREDALIQIGADLLFPFNEWKLKPEADAALKDAAAKVLSTPRTSDDPIRFLGYTDNVGDLEYNQWLSEQRAGAVADWFVQHRVIPMSKIKITGFGKTQAQYNDPEGRKKDRRVDILVTKKGSAEQVCW